MIRLKRAVLAFGGGFIGGVIVRILLGALLILTLACVAPGKWSGTYVLNGQEYGKHGDGGACPSTVEIPVGRSSGSVGFDSDGNVIFNGGQTIYMDAHLKAESCEVVYPAQ